MRIQWYPGHMSKTRREMENSLSKVDAVAELVDARIPRSSRNPALDAMLSSKPRIIVLNHTDQADPEITKLWTEHFRARDIPVIECDAKSGAGTAKFLPEAKRLLADKLKRFEDKGQSGRSVHVMVVGIPNIGKSSFINRLSGRKPAKAEDRPGVTRVQQWIRLDAGIDLLDTPGMLAPKIKHFEDGLHLAFTGAVRDDILDVETLGAYLLETLARLAPDAVAARYKVALGDADTKYALLEKAARKRGFLMPGGVADTERMAKILLDEYRAGALGRLTIEKPGEKPVTLEEEYDGDATDDE